MKSTRRQRGFTLVEMLIVIGLIAIMAAIIVPNTIGYLRKGEEASYNADKTSLQTAVDSFYSDASNRVNGVRKYPTTDGTGGNTPSASTNYISMPKLIAANQLPAAPASASSGNGGTGNYGWYVDATGRVQSTPAYTAGLYP